MTWLTLVLWFPRIVEGFPMRLPGRGLRFPALANASARSRPLPLLPGRSGEHQSPSVGPLPATRTTAGNGPSPSGRVRVPRMVI